MECSICMCPLGEAPDTPSTDAPPAKKRKVPVPAKTESLTISTPCGHIFHRACLKGWLKGTKGSCPSCRHQINMRSAHPLFLDFQKMESEEPKPDPLSQLSPASGGNNAKNSQGTSRQGTSHTNLQYFELEEKYSLLKKEHEDLKEKYINEKERADMNEARVQSLLNSDKNKKITTSKDLPKTLPVSKPKQIPKSNQPTTSAAGTLSQNKTGSSSSKFQPKKDNADNSNWFSTGFNYWWSGGDPTDSED